MDAYDNTKKTYGYGQKQKTKNEKANKQRSLPHVCIRLFLKEFLLTTFVVLADLKFNFYGNNKRKNQRKSN